MQSLDFTAKTVVVVGGANGIGLAAARLFSAAHADTWVIDMENESPLEKAAGFGAHGTAADVTNRESLEAAFAQIGDEIDAVVSCAGIVKEAKVVDTDPEDWNRS
jgi:NAD(P)-dependent dehydrogenase (short-subunit alcohol dehydrogenase family)